MNTDGTKRENEKRVCQRVVDEINRIEGTDFFAESSLQDPPDCFMKSLSGNFKTREVEVTSASGDFILREDNGNLMQACGELKAELDKRQVGPYRMRLDLTDVGLRCGLRRGEIQKLADILYAELRRNRCLDMDGKKIWAFSPELADLVGGVDGYPVVDGDTVRVVPSLCALGSDGSEIANSIAKKSAKYAPRDTDGYDLVVSCAWYIGKDEVECFRRGNSAQTFPYRSIWLTTGFDGVCRIK